MRLNGGSMRALRQKLHSDSGATIIIAMAVFLIVTLLSTTIVSAALTGVRSAGLQRREEQAYLSVSSAAILLRDTIHADGPDGNRVMRVRESGTKEGVEYTYPDSYTSFGGFFPGELCKMIAGMEIGDGTYTLSCSDDGIQDVTVELSMDASKALTAVLTSAGEPYSVTLRFRYAQVVAAEMEYTPYQDVSGRTFYDTTLTQTTMMWWELESVV